MRAALLALALLALALLAAPAAEAATYTLSLREVLFDGTGTGRAWTGRLHIDEASRAVTGGRITLPGLDYLYPRDQTYTTPVPGLHRGADGWLRGHFAATGYPDSVPSLLFSAERWYSGAADSTGSFACLSCLPKGLYALTPLPVPLPAGLPLLAGACGALIFSRRSVSAPADGRGRPARPPR